MGFFLKKTFDLSEYGWEGCNINFQSLSYEEIQNIKAKISKNDDNSMENELIDFLSTKLIDGNGLNEKGEQEPITKDNFKKLPTQILVDLAYKLAGGDIDPKSA